jgi:hypothetical protein
MRCILHIGTPKTGTTSLQRVLSSNRDALAAEGVCYSRAAGKFNSRALAAAISPDRNDDYLSRHELLDTDAFQRWREALLDDINDEIADAMRSQDVYLLSSEHLTSTVDQVSDVTRLAQFLTPHFSDIKIVCYLRRQDLMAVSRISEALRAGLARRGLPNVKSKGALPAIYDYDQLLAKWGNVFGQSALHPKVFEKSQLVGGDIVTDFLETELRLKLDRPDNLPENTALSATAQLALLMFNRTVSDHSPSDTAQRRRSFVKLLERTASGPGWLPAKEDAMDFFRNFEHGNNRIATEFFNRDTLFEDRFEHYPLTEACDDIEAAENLLEQFFTQLRDLESQ